MANPHKNPYPGLRPFRPDEEHLFFGRDLQVDRMISKLKSKRFLAVIGGSGSGKSSLVNCGLRPALHRGYMASAGANWRMAQFRPGSDPIRAMTRALAAPGVIFDDDNDGFLTPEEMIEPTLRLGSLGLVQCAQQADLPEGTQLLLVVDQFEELFRFGAGEKGHKLRELTSEKFAFVKLLLEAATQQELPIHIVITMRSDFLGDCTQFEGLPEAINEGQYLVPRLTRHQIRQAITGPAQIRGEKIAPVLTTRLLNDLGDNPDQLSILQHALNRTWTHWETEHNAKGQITLDSYTAIGGMENALDRHAEKAFGELPNAKSRLLCEKVFKALTDTGTDPRGIRRITPIGTLAEITNTTIEELEEIIKVFRKASRSFLMPPEGEEIKHDSDIDISHESLMRLWKRLRRWTEEEAISARAYRNLRETALRHAKGEASLWSGPELSHALTWRKVNQPTRAWANRYGGDFQKSMDFLHESNETVRNERGKNRGRKRARIAIVGALIIILLPIVVSLLREEILAQIANDRMTARFLDDLATIDDRYRDIGAGNAALELCKRDQRRPSGDPNEPLWSALAATPILDDFCLDRRNSLSPEDNRRLIEFAARVNQGDLAEVSAALNKLPGRLAYPAYQLLGRVAHLRSEQINRERECLRQLVDDTGAASVIQTTTADTCTGVDFIHPFYRSIYELIKDSNDAQTRLRQLNKDHRHLLLAQTNQLAVNRGDKTSDILWVYTYMRRDSGEPSNLEVFSEKISPYLGVVFILLLWPLWYFWRWWQLRNGASIAARPGSHRRTAATLFDLVIAGFAGFSVYATSEFTTFVMFSYSNDFVAFAIGLLVSLSYFLYCDGIRFRFCRSLGKIAFDLRPLVITRENRIQISAGDSARRNIPKVIALAVATLASLLWQDIFAGVGPDLMGMPLADPVIGGAITLYLIVLIVAWNERRVDRITKAGSLPASKARTVFAIIYIILISAFFVWIFSDSSMLLTWEYAFFSIIWAMLVLPYLIPLLRGRRLHQTRVIDADSAESRKANMLPHYHPDRIAIDEVPKVANGQVTTA